VSTWREAALLLEQVVRDQDEELERAHQQGRYDEWLVSQQLRDEAFEAGRIAGRGEGFRDGFYFAKRGGRLYEGQVA